MIRKSFLSAFVALGVVFAAATVPSGARADVASDIAAVLANAALSIEEIAAQVATMVTGADDPSAAAAIIVAASDGASDDQLEGIGIGLGNAVLALQVTDAGEAEEVALEVTAASAEIQTAFVQTAGSTAAILAGTQRGGSLLTGDGGEKSPD